MGTIMAQRLMCDIRYTPTLDLYVQTHAGTIFKRASEQPGGACSGLGGIDAQFTVPTQSVTE